MIFSHWHIEVVALGLNMVSGVVMDSKVTNSLLIVVCYALLMDY